MEFNYTGDAHQRLFDAYRADPEPFPEPTSMEFPRREHMREEVDILKRLFFPTCWNSTELYRDELAILDRLDRLGGLFYAGICPYVDGEPTELVEDVLDRLPAIRDLLKKDVEAAYKGDPAAKTYLEIIRSYPGFLAILVQRVAHALYEAGAAEYARELTEAAKTETGIDIHPGAEIGEYFFVDHGNGVVIGETTTVGDWVRLYQDVTLGALHFEEAEGEEHKLRKGYKRHPDIGDHVVIGAGTKVLGDITIGDHVYLNVLCTILDSNEVRVDTFRSSGPGGQHANVTDSAVRLTHEPSGIVVTCQDESSQHKNRKKAWRVLRSRYKEKIEEARAEERDSKRRGQIGQGQRSEKIRTYNFPQNRVTDHRIHYTTHNLEGIMEGEIDELITALEEAEEKEKLENLDVSELLGST